MDTVSLGDSEGGGAALWTDRAPGRSGPKPALSLERIADAAVAIADTEGIAAVSMQRIAAEFQYTKMALYRYVAGKDELLALMIDRAVGAPPDLSHMTGGWRVRLEEWVRLLIDQWEAHPWLPWATMGDRVMGPNEVGCIDRALGTLAGTGLDPAEQMAIVMMICGHIRNTHSVATAGTQPWSASEQRDVLTGRTDEFPALLPLLDALESPDRGRAFGLECLLDGVEALLAKRRRQRRRPP